MNSLFKILGSTLLTRPLLNWISIIAPHRTAIFWFEHLLEKKPLPLSGLSSKTQAYGLSLFCKVAELRHLIASDNTLNSLIIDDDQFKPLLNCFFNGLHLQNEEDFHHWIKRGHTKKELTLKTRPLQKRPQSTKTWVSSLIPVGLTLTSFSKTSKEILQDLYLFCKDTPQDWSRRSDVILMQILDKKSEAQGAAIALLCSFAARTEQNWLKKLIPLLKKDPYLSQQIVEYTLSSAERSSWHFCNTQINARSNQSPYKDNSDYYTAKNNSTKFIHFHHHPCFLSISNSPSFWLSNEGNPQHTYSAERIQSILNLATACSPSGNLIWDAAHSNRPQACLGTIFFGFNPDLPGPDGLRAIDIATKKGRALLYRCLVLGGADCITKGIRARKTPAELGEKLLREDLGSELKSMAERAQIHAAIYDSSVETEFEDDAPVKPSRSNRL